MTDKPKPFKQGMTLMPGETASVTFSLPAGPEIAKLVKDLKPGDTIPLEMVEVPPPDEAPIDPEAEALGLVRGLRVQHQTQGYRCAECGNMQPPDSALVWVPDGMYRGAGEDVVEEMCRRNAYNGHSGGWCLKCARTLGHRGPIHELGRDVPEAELIGDIDPRLSLRLCWILLGILAAFAVGMMVFPPHR